MKMEMEADAKEHCLDVQEEPSVALTSVVSAPLRPVSPTSPVPPVFTPSMNPPPSPPHPPTPTITIPASRPSIGASGSGSRTLAALFSPPSSVSKEGSFLRSKFSSVTKMRDSQVDLAKQEDLRKVKARLRLLCMCFVEPKLLLSFIRAN